MPYLLLFFERVNKIGRLRQIGWRRHKDLKLQGYALVGKKQLMSNVDNVASYTIAHNSTNVLCRGFSGPSVVKGVRLISEEVKGHARRHLKTMRESINSAIHTWVVIKCVAIEVAEFRGVPL